jgi:PAT family acetyl-CoA transporter-like MFS transporter 1
MFVSSSAFYTQIADPVIGGTYLTLLNTVSNLGGTWPRYFVLRGVDFFTQATCILPEKSELESTPPHTDSEADIVRSCATEPEKLACIAAEGECHKYVDGYYIVNTLCVGIAFVMFMWYIRPRVTKLQGIPQLAWKIPLK